MEDFIISMAIVAVFLLILGFGGILADYVLPRIKPLARWVDGLVREKAEWNKAIKLSGARRFEDKS